MFRAVNAESKLRSVAKKLGVSSDGLLWLDVALDPFKDVQGIKPTGFPDQIAVPSAVEVISDEVVVSVPAGVAGDWDCNIFLDKLYTSVDLYSTTNNYNVFHQSGQGGTPYVRGGCVVRSAATGTTLDITKTTGGLPLKQDSLANAEVRLLAIGMEIHNTTSPLNKQGSVIVWRILEDREEFPTDVTCDKDGATAVVASALPAVPLPAIPSTPGQAIDLKGSLQWEAKEGAYIIPLLADETNPPVANNRMGVIDDELTPTMYFPQIVNSSLMYSIDTLTCKQPFCVAGAYFTGLSQETELQVNLKYYVEVFPNKSNVLRRFTGNGCPFDPAALQMYTKIAEKMPVGVPVKDNFLGALISGVANAARLLLPAATSAMNLYRENKEVVDTGMNLVKSMFPVSTGAVGHGTSESLNGFQQSLRSVPKALGPPSGAIVPSPSKKPEVVVIPPKSSATIVNTSSKAKVEEVVPIETSKSRTTNVRSGRVVMSTTRSEQQKKQARGMRARAFQAAGTEKTPIRPKQAWT